MHRSSRGAVVLLCLSLALTFFPCSVVSQFTQGTYGFYGAGNDQYDFSHCLDGSGSGSIFATGSTDGTALGQSTVGSGGYDWVTVKFDKNNGFLTSNNNNPVLRFLYTSGTDAGHSCVSDTSGAVYVAGVTTGTLGTGSTCSNGNRDSVVAKYDSAMHPVWTVQLDVAGSCYNDWAVKILLFGNTLYVIGNANTNNNGQPWQVYIVAINTADGTSTAPRFYGGAPSMTINVRDASVDPNGNIVIVGGYQGANLPSSSTANGSVIAGHALIGYVSGFVAGFDNAGSLRWQLSNGAGTYSQMLGVTTDVTGAVYAGGFTEGSLYGATYTGSGTLPLMQKLDVNGNLLWTVIYPSQNYQGITHVVTDNIGGVYWLGADTSSSQCYGSYSSAVLYLDSDYTCGNPFLNIYKSDVNGAVQFVQGFSTGIAQSFTIDNSGLLTIAGDISQSFQLHGSTPPNGGWSGFVDQQSINYNCSCSNLASLVTQMSQLLNISTS